MNATLDKVRGASAPQVAVAVRNQRRPFADQRTRSVPRQSSTVTA